MDNVEFRIELINVLTRIADALDQQVRLEMPQWKGWKEKDSDTDKVIRLAESGRALAGDEVTDRAIEFLKEN